MFYSFTHYTAALMIAQHPRMSAKTAIRKAKELEKALMKDRAEEDKRRVIFRDKMIEQREKDRVFKRLSDSLKDLDDKHDQWKKSRDGAPNNPDWQEGQKIINEHQRARMEIRDKIRKREEVLQERLRKKLGFEEVPEGWGD